MSENDECLIKREPLNESYRKKKATDEENDAVASERTNKMKKWNGKFLVDEKPLRKPKTIKNFDFFRKNGFSLFIRTNIDNVPFHRTSFEQRTDRKVREYASTILLSYMNYGLSLSVVF